MTRVHAAWSHTYTFCNASTYNVPGLQLVQPPAFRRVTCGRCLELIGIKRNRRLRLPRKRYEPAWFFEHPADEIRRRYSDLFTPEYEAIHNELMAIDARAKAASNLSRRKARLRRQLEVMIADVPCRCDCFETPCGCRRCLAEAEMAST